MRELPQLTSMISAEFNDCKLMEQPVEADS